MKYRRQTFGLLRSPVALVSDDGYTQLVNGCMDHGWYVTCLQLPLDFTLPSRPSGDRFVWSDSGDSDNDQFFPS